MISLVQSATPTGTTVGTATSVTSAGITTTSGNFIVIAFTTRSGAGEDITDNYSNTISFATSVTDGTNRVSIYYIRNLVGGSGHTFTLTSSSACYMTLLIQEWSGLSAAIPLDKTTGATSNGLNSGFPGNTSYATELIVGACINVSSSISVGSGYSNFISYNASPATGNTFGGLESKTVSVIDNYNATFGGTASQDCTVVATFADASVTTTSTSSSTSTSLSSTSSSTSISTSTTTTLIDTNYIPFAFIRPPTLSIKKRGF